MNKANGRKWYRALMSGEYTQGAGALAEITGDGKSVRYCCLGVACEVAIADGLKLDKELVGEFYQYDKLGEMLVLPHQVSQWLGLAETRHDDNPQAFVDGEDHYLTELNDTERWDFVQIAEAIRTSFDLGTHEEIMNERV